jgi:threonine dehydrogenase-like Zn-dependent dehydrogenase
MMLAHSSQLFEVPDQMSDKTAVIVEPFACAIHSALRAEVPDGGSVLVVGAGTVGILTLLGIKALTKADHVVVAAKHTRQRAAAKLAGADEVIQPEHAVKAVRRSEHAVKLSPERGMEFLLGGVDVAIDCVGSRSALDLALRTTKAGGRVVLSGIPAQGADLTPLWFRELQLVGAYTSGTEHHGGAPKRTFDMAIEMATGLPILEDLVGATYPLDRWREAIDHALSAGRLGTFKVAFAPQE